MLSWSSDHAGEDVDVAGLRTGDGVGDERNAALWRFASACAERDDDELAAARAALVATTDEATMVDAAAVAANFEMMTRLADSTGARMPASVLEDRAQAIGVMGVGTLTSKR